MPKTRWHVGRREWVIEHEKAREKQLVKEVVFASRALHCLNIY